MQKIQAQFLQNILIFFLVFTSSHHVVVAKDSSVISMRLDGFNTSVLNQEYPHQLINAYSIINGNPLDQFPFDILPHYSQLKYYNNDSLQSNYTDSLFHLQASAIIGAEAGDLILKQFEHATTSEYPYNRDHFTVFAGAFTFPYTPLNLFFGYRYIDSYSDRFDSLVVIHKKTTGKNVAFTDEGLAFELVTGYNFAGSVVSSQLKTISYKHWNATPYFFSPLFQTGYQLIPSISVMFPKSHLDLNFTFDYQKTHFNHDANWYKENLDEAWSIIWRRNSIKNIHVQLSHHFDSKFDPSHYFYASLNDTVSNLFTWNLLGKFYSNFRFGGSFGCDYIQIPHFSMKFQSSWDYKPKTRDYTFINENIPVEYYAMKYEVTDLHTSLNYFDTLFYPASVSFWLDYCDKPIWETKEFFQNSLIEKYIIKQDTLSSSARVTFGGRAAYTISFKKFNIDLWGNFAIKPKNKNLRLSLPRNLGADLTYGNPDNASFYALLRIENRDRTALKYFDKNNNEFKEFQTPANTSMTITLKSPLVLPFFRNFARMGVQLDGGPIRVVKLKNFRKNQRIKEHPGGNLIGPAISLRVNGYIN